MFFLILGICRKYEVKRKSPTAKQKGFGIRRHYRNSEKKIERGMHVSFMCMECRIPNFSMISIALIISCR